MERRTLLVTTALLALLVSPARAQVDIASVEPIDPGAPATRIELTVALGGELRVESSSGTKLINEDYDPAPGIGLQAHFRF